mgnify:CR=1 FL=1
MAAVRCTAPARGHVPGSQAQRQCPVHGDRSARTSPLPVPAAPSAPAPERASEHTQTVRPDGTVIEEWHKDGVLHREGGPAYVERRRDGTAVIEWWYRNNKLHREGGPAWVRRSPDGTVESEAWWLDDKRVEQWEVLGRHLLRQGTPELSTEALRQIAKDVPWQRWSELGPDHPLVALWGTVHPSAEISAG